MKRKCSFSDAVLDLALFSGVDKIEFNTAEPSAGESSVEPDEHEESVTFLEPPEPDLEYINAMADATDFYSQLLTGNPDRFKKVHGYLQGRGVSLQQVQDFGIGFAPAPGDDEFAGRALIRNFLDRFNADYGKGGLGPARTDPPFPFSSKKKRAPTKRPIYSDNPAPRVKLI